MSVKKGKSLGCLFTDKTYLKYVLFVSHLLNEELLPKEAQDHSLKGDLLVIYVIEEETLKLIRIGSHSELFD